MERTRLLNKILKSGLAYTEYIQNTIEELANTDPAMLNGIESERYTNKKLNLHRAARIEKTYHVNDELAAGVEKIIKPQTWMVLTESWCGDSAQIIPYIWMMTKDNPNITLKMVLRDSYPEIMDQFLTNGTRSIPVIAGFDANGNELFRWGPRPQTAVELVKELKAQGLEKKAWLEKLHLWYGRNRGQEIEKEMLELLIFLSVP
jgi:hypothetical protein